MQFFLDTADLDEIRALTASGLVDGVTTNPSLIAKSGRDIFETIAAICDLTDGPVSAEVTAQDAPGMIKEGHRLADIARNVCIKVPLTWEGLIATKALSDEGHQVNVTLCFSTNQALLAAKAGATFVSPFIGRLDDTGVNGMELIGEIRAVYDNYEDLDTQILAASIRGVNHVRESALLGADVATIPAKVLKALVHHPLTDKGLTAFMTDWESTGQSIL